jgi:hypothetical protein
LVATPLLLASVRGGRGLALFVSALAVLVVWIGLNQGGEAIMGLKMHPLFTVSAGFGLLALLPLLRAGLSGFSCVASLILAVVLAVAAGFQPAYSERAPERLNLRYAEMEGKAFWLADPVARLPPGLRAAAAFSASPQQMGEVGGFYVAPAGRAHFPAPHVQARRVDQELTLEIDAPGDGFTLLVPQAAQVKAIRMNDVEATAATPLRGIGCATPGCGHTRLTLRLGAEVREPLTLVAYRQGLPAEGRQLLAARPRQAVPSQGGDRTVLVTRIQVPAR